MPSYARRYPTGRNRWGAYPPPPGRKDRRYNIFLHRKLFREYKTRDAILDLDNNIPLDKLVNREEAIPSDFKNKLQAITETKITRGNIKSILKNIVRTHCEYLGSKFNKDIYAMNYFTAGYEDIFEAINYTLLSSTYGTVRVVMNIDSSISTLQRIKYKL